MEHLALEHRQRNLADKCLNHLKLPYFSSPVMVCHRGVTALEKVWFRVTWLIQFACDNSDLVGRIESGVIWQWPLWIWALVVTTVISWFHDEAVRSTVIPPEHDKKNLGFDVRPARKCPFRQSKETGSELFVLLCERLARGQLCHLRFTTLHSFCFPVGFLPLEYENALSLNKSLPQLQFVSFLSAVFLPVANETWTGNGIIGVINARWQSWQKTKTICLYSPGGGEVWEQPHYALARINLRPLSVSFHLGSLMHYSALRILNRPLNLWCRFLIDLHVRWRTEHMRQYEPNVENTGVVLQFVTCFIFILFYHKAVEKGGPIRRDFRFSFKSWF